MVPKKDYVSFKNWFCELKLTILCSATIQIFGFCAVHSGQDIFKKHLGKNTFYEIEETIHSFKSNKGQLISEWLFDV